MTDTDRDVVNAMIKFGGSFVQRLGTACLFADAANLALVKATWPQYWSRYAECARLEMLQQKAMTS